MFDFTTETILNDLSRVTILDSSEDPTLAAGEKAFYVKRLNKFRKANVKAIYKSAGYAAVNEIAHVAVPASVTAGDLLRVNISATLSGSQDGAYSRWAVNKGKPFFAEYLVLTTSAAVDTHGPLIAASVNSILKKQGISDVVVTYNSTSDKLEITATNEYQRFVEVYFEKYNDTTDEFEITATGTTKTAGKEGFGTSWYLTKNSRLPTIEAIRFMGEYQDELPVANSLYSQYTIQYEAERNITGQGAVGEALVSKTTHVFFVISTQTTAFEDLLQEAFGTNAITDAITGAATEFSALADIVFTPITVSAAAAIAHTYVGSLKAFLADYTLATGVTYALVSGTGSTDNALFEIVGDVVRTASTITSGAKAFRVEATDANGTYAEALAVTIAA